MSRASSGNKHKFYFDLSVARDGKQETVLGRYIRISNASDSAAKISIAVQENVPSRYEELKKNGRIREGDGFDRIYITNEAQPGKWLTIIVSEGESDYDVDNPAISTIDEIVAPVLIDSTEPVKVDDDATQALLTTIDGVLDDIKLDTEAIEAATEAVEALLTNDQDKRAALTTLAGASFASRANSAGTTTAVTSGANVNGVIIRHAYCSGTPINSSAVITVGGNNLLASGNTGGSSVGGDTSIIQNFFVPAGVAIAITLAGSFSQAGLWYEVL